VRPGLRSVASIEVGQLSRPPGPRILISADSASRQGDSPANVETPKETHHRGTNGIGSQRRGVSQRITYYDIRTPPSGERHEILSHVFRQLDVRNQLVCLDFLKHFGWQLLPGRNIHLSDQRGGLLERVNTSGEGIIIAADRHSQHARLQHYAQKIWLRGDTHLVTGRAASPSESRHLIVMACDNVRSQ
jgi:hypothetical protein